MVSIPLNWVRNMQALKERLEVQNSYIRILEQEIIELKKEKVQWDIDAGHFDYRGVKYVVHQSLRRLP